VIGAVTAHVPRPIKGRIRLTGRVGSVWPVRLSLPRGLRAPFVL